MQERGICLAVTEKLPKDSGVAGVKVYDDIVKKLLNKKEAKGMEKHLYFLTFKMIS